MTVTPSPQSVVVPVEPTPKMMAATWDHEIDKSGGIESQNTRNARIWSAMLAAAPAAPQAAGVGEITDRMVTEALKERFTPERYARDHEYLEANFREATRRQLNAALLAQPQSREEAQPVAWQRRIRNTAVPSSDPKSQWSKWADCDDRQRRDVQETGGVPGFPELVAEVRPIYTHPAAPSADKLRIATDAFDAITDLGRALRSGGPDSSDLNDLSDNLDSAVNIAAEALAALKADGA